MGNRGKKTGINAERPVTGRMIGYARVSTKQQSLQMQIDYLIEEGVHPEDIFKEKMSGRIDKRPELDKALRSIRSGDYFVVYKLDRLGRDLPELIRRLDWFAKQDIVFKSITEGISINLNKCRPAERLQVNMIAALAQFEVDLDRERTANGVQKAQERGVKFGAKEKITDNQVKAAMVMRDKGASMATIAKKYKVSVQTINRRFKKYVKDNS